MENVVYLEMEMLIDSVLDRIDAGAEVTLAGCGTSMFPFIDETTDRIVLSHPEHVPLRVGQIYLYRRANGRYSIHRLYRMEGETFAMLGDNQYFIERGIRRCDLLAVVTAVIKPDGRVDCVSDAAVRRNAGRMKRRIALWRLRRMLFLPVRAVGRLKRFIKGNCAK